MKDSEIIALVFLVATAVAMLLLVGAQDINTPGISHG